MILNKLCLRCGSSQNLNTSMTVNIDDKKYDITLCDAHAEDTTPKKVKDLVAKKINEYNDLLLKMKEFGISAGDPDTNELVVPRKVEQDIQEAQSVQAVQTAPVPSSSAVKTTPTAPTTLVAQTTVSKKIIKKTSLPPVVPRIIDSVNQNVQQHQSLNIQEAMKAEATAAQRKGKEVTASMATEQIETQVVAGRGGQPMVIPKNIRHSDGGNTQITVVNTGGDKLLQDRAKGLSEQSRSDNPYLFSKKGYDVKECNICNGTGIARVGGNTCPKCKGVGLLNKGW